MANDVLIVDDEADIRDLVGDILEDEGYEVRRAANADEALEQVGLRRPSLVLLDIWLEGSRLDGIEILQEIMKDHSEIPVIMMSGHGTIETAVTAIKYGAYDFIQKPFDTDRLLLLVGRAIEQANLKRENAELKLKSGQETSLVGTSSIVNALRQNIKKIAPTNSRVLIQGPAGCGKEVAARMLHSQSRRASGPFVTVSAATMDPDRLERELFGVEEDGKVHVGTLERAHGGTLFLDEVADMPTETQAKILRVLVEQAFVRVGGGTRVKVDVRIVSATSRDLRLAIEQGQFREDLYHRLSVVPLEVPSLRDRLEDIPELATHFVRRAVDSSGLPPRAISEDTIAAMQAYQWPGNVRQLRNLIERLMIMCDDSTDGKIEHNMLPEEFREAAAGTLRSDRAEQIMGLPLREAREVFEREYLMAQINRFGGNVSRTASFVGMERSALHRKLKLLGIASNTERPA